MSFKICYYFEIILSVFSSIDNALRSKNLPDLMFDKNIIQVYKSKGSKTRLAILCPRLKVNLMKYCVIHRKYGDIYQLDPMFFKHYQ